MTVLDTHVWIWWVSDPARIPDAAIGHIRAAIDAGEKLRISSISAWEVAMLVARERLQLTVEVDEWIANAETVPYFEFIPVDNRVAVRSVHLPDFAHGDPADRLIVATAQGLGATLVTGDRRLHRYQGVKTIWT